MFLLRSKVLFKRRLCFNCINKTELKGIRNFPVSYVRRVARVHRNIEDSQEAQLGVNHESYNDRSDTMFETSVSLDDNDYFGIESDTNAIIVNDLPESKLRKPKSVIDKTDFPISDEKLYYTSFGNVRRDFDNKVLYHGQYEMSISNETTFENEENEGSFDGYDKKPISSSTYSLKNNLNSELLQDQQNTNEIHARFKTKLKNKFKTSPDLSDLNKLDNKPNIKVSHFNENTEHSLSSETECNEHIDQNKVCLDVPENKFIKEEAELFNKQETNHSENEISNNMCYSFIDNSYFSDMLKETGSGTISNDENTRSSKNDKNLNTDRSESKTKSSNQLEAADANFPTSTGLVNNLSDQDSVQGIEHVKCNSINKNMNDLSFIDKIYFTDSNYSTGNQDVTLERREQNDNVETTFKNSFSDVDQNSLLKQELPKKISGLNTRRKAQKPMIVNVSSINDTTNDKSNWESGDYFDEISSPDPSIYSDSVAGENKLYTHSKKSGVEIHSADATKYINKLRTIKGKTKNIDSYTVFPVESKHSSAPNKCRTAHDFIMNIRKEKDILHNVTSIEQRKIASHETLDSKGFRILKTQVQNLSFYTKDEILQMLKQRVLYSDNEIIVLNKPYNLVIHDSKTSKDPCLSTFLDDLAQEFDRESQNPKLFTVHRLDKETTGCLLLARTEVMAQHLKSLFAQRKILKTYWIVTTKVPDPIEGTINIPIAEGFITKKARMVLHPVLPDEIKYKSHATHGKRAVSHYKVIATSGNAALVEVKPETGIKHQIRVHFGFGLSCPILGDHKYSHLTKLAPQTLPSDMLQRLCVRQSKVRHIPMHIHSHKLVIPEYLDGRNLFVSAPLPEHMSANLRSLKFRKS